MDYLTMKDGTQLFYKDWGQGPAIVFSHGWPLDADEWDAQMLGLLQSGYRVIAYDRRGYGRSSQRTAGDTINTYADDLACLIDELNLNDIALIGHGAGCGEIARFVYRHGTAPVSRIILISPALPGISETTAALSKKRLDTMRHKVKTCRAEYMRQLAEEYFNVNLGSHAPTSGLLDFFWAAAMTSSIESLYNGIGTFYETDFTEDLRAFDVPTLFISGTEDQIIPIQASTMMAVTLVRNATKKFYPGAPHELCLAIPEQITADIYAFLAD
ncbi:Non-heme chloroperoxidase [Paraburkholderia nemoris]|uniref:alpha/beta fold hydrolase n=1 Tax=Paraburkholderia nemoris TaxID=2793076 RepID=UPI001912FE17|nr:alpha/beta hydrolase [Paraburkholderia nemoris]MBK5148555.1 alpha/beta hydrolase [Burkholderia sp. R-69608]CAE6906283.1 Non-heme chloroperoxidase [Paraburkholderia nemoris]